MTSVLLRYPPDVTERLDKILEELKGDPEFRAVRLSRSAIMRMALYEGLDVLERRAALTKHA